MRDLQNGHEHGLPYCYTGRMEGKYCNIMSQEVGTLEYKLVMAQINEVRRRQRIL